MFSKFCCRKNLYYKISSRWLAGSDPVFMNSLNGGFIKQIRRELNQEADHLFKKGLKIFLWQICVWQMKRLFFPNQGEVEKADSSSGLHVNLIPQP